ncbi:MAG: HAMP domain-containing histidine kinase [Gemmatimonadetes bacterium]|nr:HAMP domain-containing histidine kinase [Gemmatimonadota bacterium]
MTRRPVLWLAALAATAAVAAEWMRAPGWAWAVGLVPLAALEVWAASRAPERRETGAGLALAAGAGVVVAIAALVAWSTWRLHRIERSWVAVREAEITAASRRLGGELDGAVARARATADRAAPALALPPAAAFAALAPLVRHAGATHAVALFDARGRPVAWAGPQRARISPQGPELSAVTTSFYLWLVARRQTSAGTAVATVMIARQPGVPPTGVALTDRFAQRTGVALRFLDPRTAPADSDVFDYVLRSGPHAGDTLFAVRPVPPEQGAAREEALSSARRLLFWGVMVGLLIGAGAAARARLPLRVALLPAAGAALFIARAPLAGAFGPGSVFWPDAYYRQLLGPYSASAGALLLAGLVSALLGCALWRRGLRPSFWSRAVALAVTVLAPYLLQDLARGITPPAGGVATGLWLTWQIALVLAASAVVLSAAALVRGETAPARVGPWPLVAGAIAVGAAVAGLWLWQPVGAWPAWYPYLWVPALLLALKPMRFHGTVATVAIVAGSAAALLTWGATTKGRVALAARDVEALGARADPLAVALLDRLVHETPTDSAPESAGDLYVLWRRSALGEQGYPASLALWSARDERLLALDLAELDLPPALLEASAREAREERLPTIRGSLRVPGMHGVAAIPFDDGRVLTIGVGPRTRLVAPSRLGEFLVGGAAEPDPPYELALAPPEPFGGSVPTTRVAWRRGAWTVHGERVLELPGGPRHAHALIALRGPAALLQRGALVLILDVVILAALWLLVEIGDGRQIPAVRSWWPRAHRSLRVRLTVSLAVFFVAPTLAFAAWSYGRLGEEFSSARELLLQRTLRDAGAFLAAEPPGDAVAVLEAARRVDAELLLSRGGEVVASSAPALADLGLTDRLVPAPAFTRLAYGDELELAMAQPVATPSTLVGYRLLARTDPSAASILAAPEILGDATLRRREGDLGIAVLVATAAGIVAALVLSAIAARALARPLQRLRRAALAAGSGQRPAPDPGMPVELEPVHAAIAQAATDVEAGRRAQRVLAWGEMARQVAHEIKNPLTPIRLGIQHLLRLHGERSPTFGAVLSSTGERILAEIDRLDAIARTFSRFALPVPEGHPLEPVELGGVTREVLRLYQMGGGGTSWQLEAEDGAVGLARRDELAQVLVNLCENARDAGATRVVVAIKRIGAPAGAQIEVRDDGRGIAADVLPRVFEPRFSTTTSGSGLGLAITKRLVEGWGGTIAIASKEGAGTAVTVRLAGPGPRAPA